MPVPATKGPFLPSGSRVALDGRIRLWGADGDVVLGGTPWGVVRLGTAAADLVLRLRSAGERGLELSAVTDLAAADRLVGRGIVHPVPLPCAAGRSQVQVVVPAYGRPDLLEACLASLAGADVVVVDDASPADDVALVARRHGARLVRHTFNRGPAAARNTGLAATLAPLVAFVDADCRVTDGWLDVLVPLFDDARVGAVAPRVLPRSDVRTLLARHEQARSALDMGRRRELVRHGGALGFLPSAALVLRRDAVSARPFDEAMRVGEDVDLIWRLLEEGWLVRYEPSAQVCHEMRLDPRDWARRRYEYGTSAQALDRRHPGRLAPARPSAWNLAAIAALVAGRPRLAAALSATASAALAVRLRRAGVCPAVAALVVTKGTVADAAALGHALRREWWPVGWAALLASARSRPAQAAALSMLAPIGLEWWRARPDVDPARYALLRLLEDAAYGSGVIVSAVTGGRPRALAPQVRFPGRPLR